MQSSLFSVFVAAIYGMTVCLEAVDNALSILVPPGGPGANEGGGLFEPYAGLGNGLLPQAWWTAESRGRASPRQGIIIWQRSQRNDGRRVSAPGDLKTVSSARSILDVLRLVPNRSRMSVTRHGEQRNLPR